MAIGTQTRGLILAGIMLTAAACRTPGPRPFAFGAEECSHCHMTLADPRFAAQLVLSTGKVLPFDDVGCLATYLSTGGAMTGTVHSLWVNDFQHSDSLIPVARAVFLRSDSLRTPMNYGIVALHPGAGADSLRDRLGGTLMRWDEVLSSLASTRRP